MRLFADVPLAVLDRGPWNEPPLIRRCEKNGCTDMYAATCDLQAATRWVLERGNKAEVISPRPLRQQVATAAWRIYRRYRADGGHLGRALPGEWRS